MKKLMPLVIALVGLAAGVGVGTALKPAPDAHAAACAATPEAGGAGGGEAAAAHPPSGGDHGAAEPAADACPPDDPFAPETAEGHGDGDKTAGKTAQASYVPIEKPFIVPIFAGEKTVAMVVVSLSIVTEGASKVEAVQPRLRDSFLKVMFRHANSGGFDGSYTTGRRIEDLKSALLAAAREVMRDAPVDEVLITEIARQDS